MALHYDNSMSYDIILSGSYSLGILPLSLWEDLLQGYDFFSQCCWSKRAYKRKPAAECCWSRHKNNLPCITKLFLSRLLIHAGDAVTISPRWLPKWMRHSAPVLQHKSGGMEWEAAVGNTNCASIRGVCALQAARQISKLNCLTTHTNEVECITEYGFNW